MVVPLGVILHSTSVSILLAVLTTFLSLNLLSCLSILFWIICCSLFFCSWDFPRFDLPSCWGSIFMACSIFCIRMALWLVFSLCIWDLKYEGNWKPLSRFDLGRGILSLELSEDPLEKVSACLFYNLLTDAKVDVGEGLPILAWTLDPVFFPSLPILLVYFSKAE